jgi:diacylglycerol kinase (ATP)
VPRRSPARQNERVPGPSRLLVAVNPTASFGRGRDAGPVVLDRLRSAGHEVTGLLRSSLGELREAAGAEIASGSYDALVVVGGDGMVHFGADCVAGTDLPLGVIPSGTGNDFARGVGIPLGDPQAAVSALLEALSRPARRIDAIRVTRADDASEWVLGAVSAGFDALVSARANRMSRPRGASRYTVAMLRELAGLRPLHYRLTIDGTVSEEQAVLLAVANNGFIGGGMHIAPDAVLDDGELDLLLVRPLGRVRFLTLFPRVFSGRHAGLPQVRLERVRRVRIDSPDPLPVEVEAVPGAVLLLAP